MSFDPEQRTFESQEHAELQAAELSKGGNYYAVINQGSSCVIVQDRNPDLLDEDEILVAVYKNGEQVEWAEVYD